MINLIWNCRGLGSDTVVRALHGLIRKYRPSVVFLMETKMQNHRIVGVRRRMGFVNGWDVLPVGSAGGLSLWWDDSLEWIAEELSPTRAPWFCAGDFNEILSEDEKSGGSPWHRSTIPFLQSFLNSMELVDLGFSGPKFTWRGTRNGSLVQERLDRGLINGSWQTR
ncbi:hypothetical protein ACFX1W_038326 [Malus domestica]